MSTDQLEMSKNLEEIERKICFYQLFLNNYIFEKKFYHKPHTKSLKLKKKLMCFTI